jgi:hypothetical protein
MRVTSKILLFLSNSTGCVDHVNIDMYYRHPQQILLDATCSGLADCHYALKHMNLENVKYPYAFCTCVLEVAQFNA